MPEAMSDAQIQELIRIADAGIKERKRHWYSLGFKVTHYFRLDEQLDAVRKLGESRNPRALNYLRELAVEERQGSEEGFDHQYPNAKGELGNTLHHSYIYPDGGKWDSSVGMPGSQGSSEYQKAKRVLKIAVFQLEEALNCHPN